MGEAGDFVRKVARKAVLKAMTEFAQQAGYPANGLYQVGCLTADQTKVTLPDGSQFKVIIKGTVGDPCGPIVRMNSDTYYFLGSEIKMIQVDGGKDGLVLITDDFQEYFIKKLKTPNEFGDDIAPELYKLPTTLLPTPDYVINPSTQFPFDAKLDNEKGYPEVLHTTTGGGTIDNAGSFLPCNIVRFSYDQKSLVMANFTDDNGITVFHWVIMKNFTLKKDPETEVCTVESTTITSGELAMDQFFVNSPTLCYYWDVPSIYGTPTFVERYFNNTVDTLTQSGAGAAPCTFACEGETISTHTYTYYPAGHTNDLKKTFIITCDLILRSEDGEPKLDIMGNAFGTGLLENDHHFVQNGTEHRLDICSCATQAVASVEDVGLFSSDYNFNYYTDPFANWKKDFYRIAGTGHVVETGSESVSRVRTITFCNGGVAVTTYASLLCDGVFTSVEDLLCGPYTTPPWINPSTAGSGSGDIKGITKFSLYHIQNLNEGATRIINISYFDPLPPSEIGAADTSSDLRLMIGGNIPYLKTGYTSGPYLNPVPEGKTQQANTGIYSNYIWIYDNINPQKWYQMTPAVSYINRQIHAEEVEVFDENEVFDRLAEDQTAYRTTKTKKWIGFIRDGENTEMNVYSIDEDSAIVRSSVITGIVPMGYIVGDLTIA